jgi:hypothetical protein
LLKKVGADEPTKQQGGRAKDALLAVANGGTARCTVEPNNTAVTQPSINADLILLWRMIRGRIRKLNL